MYGYDSTYILVLIGAVITMLASANVNSAFKKYSKVLNARGLRAEEVAAIILKNADINNVKIDHIRGSLTDHYSPTEMVLRLSDTVYGSGSVAAIGVAAHECGHAIQHKEGYAPLKLRSASVPLASIGSKASMPLIILGLILGLTGLAKAGVILFSFVVIFQLITLPVEFDASSRALRILEDYNILEASEMEGTRKVLRAAAMTYVAAVFSSILQLLRLVMIMNNNRNRR